jgi:hypothetical protein
MPITLTIQEGLSAAEGALFARLTEAVRPCRARPGNRVMTPNVVGTINAAPKSRGSTAGPRPPPSSN